ncbi:hypothetical protein TIFTF001_039751 [Ficus carica]|uniref:Uncharacterized protein n=1 Tax=Ficus carica TaxID=3494 RepID=A0AA87Z5H8_FICCA|nr:hypothetical protein TIFTF001_039751 [Ficus carica]
MGFQFGFLPPEIPLISVDGHVFLTPTTANGWQPRSLERRGDGTVEMLATAKPTTAWRGDGGDGAGAAMGRQRPADGATEVWCRRGEGRTPTGFGGAKECDVQLERDKSQELEIERES